MNFVSVAVVNKVNHHNIVGFCDQVHVGRTSWRHLHVLNTARQIYFLNYLMKLKIANQQRVALADETNVASEIVVQELGLRVVLRDVLVVYELSLRDSIVMVQGVHAFGLCEAVVHVLLQVERVHEDENRWLVLVEQFLFERVAVLAVVDDHLAVFASD